MRKGRIRRLLLLAITAVVVLLGLLVYTFTPSRLDVSAYPAPVFQTPDSSPSALPETSLSLIKCGKMMSKQVFVFRGGSWSEAYESGMAAVLVRHPKRSFLFDAGFGANVDEHIKMIPALMRRLTTYDKETSAAAQLKAHGFDPNEIKMAIISHSHWDHVSGLEDFPQAEAWFAKEEIEDIPALPAGELIQQMKGGLKLNGFEFTGVAYENFDRSYDLFGDTSVVLVPLPGHTPGSIGMFVNLRSGKRFFFIGDLTWALEGIELPAERPWISRKLVDRNEEQVRAAIVKVHQLMKRHPDLVVVPAHDRRVHERIAIFPDQEH
jgi:glyoxylase-like metal-dependent hydrolase (beta-lactamase superfamily II)